jgi:hypothetical protein
MKCGIVLEAAVCSILMPVSLAFVPLVPVPLMAQRSTAATLAAANACGPALVKFEIVRSDAQKPAVPNAGKALVFFVEEDLNLRTITHTSRFAVDGNWAGATHGSGYFYFMVDPGVHHLCATTQTGSTPDDGMTALAHFTAEAGTVYYFEMKNVVMVTGPGSGNSTNDATLIPLDSDEGAYLTSRLRPVTSRPRK